jgi:hypothetical protein
LAREAIFTTDDARKAPRGVLAAPAVPLHLRFHTVWKGRPVGHYRFEIVPRADGGGMVVRHEFSVVVKIGFITAFRYEHQVVERWGDGGLESLCGRTNDGGDEAEVRAVADRSRLRVEGPEGSRDQRADLLTTTCAWHPAFVSQQRLLDASDGNIVTLNASRIGPDHISMNGDPVAAEAFTFVSERMAGALWYAPQGALLRAEIERKGQRLQIVAED